jgi:NADPH-dependent ferric siderophore reductase
MFLSDLLPATISWQPRAGDLVLLGAVADDLPVVETVLATLPAKARGQVFVEVDSADAVRELAAPGRVCVTWLRRDLGQTLRGAVEAWLGEMLPVDLEREHRVYGWVSGDRTAQLLTNS